MDLERTHQTTQASSKKYKQMYGELRDNHVQIKTERNQYKDRTLELQKHNNDITKRNISLEESHKQSQQQCKDLESKTHRLHTANCTYKENLEALEIKHALITQDKDQQITNERIKYNNLTRTLLEKENRIKYQKDVDSLALKLMQREKDRVVEQEIYNSISGNNNKYGVGGYVTDYADLINQQKLLRQENEKLKSLQKIDNYNYMNYVDSNINQQMVNKLTEEQQRENDVIDEYTLLMKNKEKVERENKKLRSLAEMNNLMRKVQYNQLISE